MKQDNELRNNLKLIRTRLGLSQQELANLAGVARQTISFVELGQCAPSVMITLRLAKALGCQVEDLFWIDEDLPQNKAVLAQPVLHGQRVRVSLAQVGGQWIAYPLIEKHTSVPEIILADDKCESQLGKNQVRVRLLDDNLNLPPGWDLCLCIIHTNT